jgi:hypothetical protein
MLFEKRKKKLANFKIRFQAKRKKEFVKFKNRRKEEILGLIVLIKQLAQKNVSRFSLANLFV